ncbi:MAG: DNA recombination protein RmuC [Vulcanimicrobiaceae bacterium]
MAAGFVETVLVLALLALVLIAIALRLSSALAARGLALEKLREELRQKTDDVVRLEARLEVLQQSIPEDAQRVEILKAQMGQVFEDKARAVLRERSDQFEQTAEQKKTALDDLLKPLKDHLDDLRSKVVDLEAKRATATTELKTTIDQLMQRTDALSTAATTLSTTLTGSAQARGRWGELHLDNLLERSGMSRYCDRDTQEYFRDLDGGARPDVLIRIPHVDLRVPVDAKAPDASYRSYLEATDEARRRATLAAHARSVENHARTLGDRDYGRFPGIAPLTIMYMPNEGMLAAAMAEDPDLWDRCARRNVYLASPLTLLIQLRAYAEGWAVYEQEQNVARIAEHTGQLYRRLATFIGHFTDIGHRLGSANEAYNRAMGSYQARLLPHARAFRELGIGVSDSDREAVEESVETIQVMPRQIAPPSPDGDELVGETKGRAAPAETVTDETTEG